MAAGLFVAVKGVGDRVRKALVFDKDLIALVDDARGEPQGLYVLNSLAGESPRWRHWGVSPSPFIKFDQSVA